MKTKSFCLAMLVSGMACAQNPIVSHVFTADPAPVVFEGIDSLYVYCDQDENVPGVNDFYYMEHYRVFSTADMVNWTDHGDAVMPRSTFKWMKPGTCWASQCVKKGSVYYWYMCGNPAPGYNYGYNVIGVGRSLKPSGPFTDALGQPLISAFGYIDPTVLIDDDKQAYLYFGNPQLSYVKLNSTMTSYKTSGTGSKNGIYEIPLTEATVGGYKDSNDKIIGVDKYEEGPWLDKRGDKYYMIYAAGGVPEHISYSMADSPTGPWEYKGQVMRTGGTDSFTNHCGIVNFKGHEYFFYHTGWATVGSVRGGGFNRSMAVEEFKFNADGTIPEIKPTKTGVKAIATMDPFLCQQAETMNKGLNINVVGNERKGVYVSGITSKSSIKLANVDFGVGEAESVTLRIASETGGGTITFRQDSSAGKILVQYNIESTGSDKTWNEVVVPLKNVPSGVHALYISFTGTGTNLCNFDWWQFNKSETDGIREVKTVVKEDANYYDLSGRKVSAPKKGVYIYKGKKIVKN